MVIEMHKQERPTCFQRAGRFCVRKRGRVAYCTELTPRQAFGCPYPS